MKMNRIFAILSVSVLSLLYTLPFIDGQATIDQPHFRVGTAVPAATCVAGAQYLRNDYVNSIHQLYVCDRTNHWITASLLNGTAAARPVNCVQGQIYLANDTSAISFCTVSGNPGTWAGVSQGPVGPQGPAGANGAISQIQSAGVNLPVRPTINFTTSGSCTDNSGSNRTDCNPGGTPGGNNGDYQKNSSGVFGPGLIHESGNLVTVGNTLASSTETLSDPRVINSGTPTWFTSGTGAVITFGTGGGSGQVVYTDDGITHTDDIYQVNTDFANPGVAAVPYYVVYNVCANPGGVTLDSTYMSSPIITLPSTVGMHNVLITSANPLYYFDISFHSTTAGQSITLCQITPNGDVFEFRRGNVVGDLTVLGNTTANGTVNSITNVQTCGVVGDGMTDDTTALNSCLALANTNPYTHLFVPRNFRIRVTDNLLIHNVSGLMVEGAVPVWTGPSFNASASAIIWDGPDTAGNKMFDILDSNAIHFKNLLIMSANGFGNTATGVSYPFYVDQSASPTNITSANTWDNVSIWGMRQKTDFVGIYLSPTSGNNVEHQTIFHSQVVCSYGAQFGSGIKIGIPAANAIGELVENTTIVNCNRGIDWNSGGGWITHNQFNLNNTHIFLNTNVVTTIDSNDSENCDWDHSDNGAWLKATASGNSLVIVRNNRMANCLLFSNKAVLQLQNGSYKIQDNIFQASATSPAISGTVATSVIGGGNNYPNDTPTITALQNLGTYVSTGDHGLVNAALIRPVAPYGVAGGEYKAGLNTLGVSPEGKWEVGEGGSYNPYNIAHYAITPYLTPSTSCGTADPNGKIGNIRVDPNEVTTIYYICLKVAGSYSWVPVPLPIDQTRTLPSVVNDAVDIGHFLQSDFAISYDVQIDWNSGNTITRHYRFGAEDFGGPGDWEVVSPVPDGPYNHASDFALEVNQSGATMYMRVRNVAGTTGGDLHVRIYTFGNTAFTASTSVNSVSPPTHQKPDASFTNYNNTFKLFNPSTFAATTDANNLTANRSYSYPNWPGTFNLNGGTKFTASGCSNSSTVGGASVGSYLSGTTGTCTVTVTFGDSRTAANGWACSAQDETTPANIIGLTGSTTTTATFSGTTTSGDKISFQCRPY